MDISPSTGKRRRNNPHSAEPLRGVPSNTAKYRMRLFIAGDEHNSAVAQKNIKEICSTHLKGNFKLEIIDVFEDFTDAIEENILVTPALVIDRPKNLKIFGNLEHKDKVLSALELK